MRCVAFLRAINVAGHATVKMVDLKQAFVSSGCTDVETCIQSGNVVFSAPGARKAPTTTLVTALRKLLGADPILMVRTERELIQLGQSAPFDPREAEPDEKRYVVFLEGKPARTPTLPLALPKEALEAIGMIDREVFVVSRRKNDGFYGFPNGFVETQFGVPATTRNWTTVCRIVELLKNAPTKKRGGPAKAAGAARPRGSSSRRTGPERRR
jgi:uncharacterized protein (DUF1697 family)